MSAAGRRTCRLLRLPARDITNFSAYIPPDGKLVRTVAGAQRTDEGEPLNIKGPYEADSVADLAIEGIDASGLVNIRIVRDNMTGAGAVQACSRWLVCSAALFTSNRTLD